jgi:hypothetical protein
MFLWVRSPLVSTEFFIVLTLTSILTMVVLFFLLISSADDMIKARAKSGVVDRAEGSRVARRNAARDARRGIASSSKPTEQEVAQQVQKKTHQRAVKDLNQTVQQANRNKKKVTFNAAAPMDTTGVKQRLNQKLKDKIAIRQQQQTVKATAALGTDTVIPRPTRAMVTAAKQAMIAAGYVFPPNTTLHVVPTNKHSTNLQAAPSTVVIPPPLAPNATGSNSGTRRRNSRGRGGTAK